MSILVEHVRRWVRDTPDRLALWSRGEKARLSFADLAERIDAWASRFRDHDGTPVAVATGNGVAFPTLVLALMEAGAPVVAMDGGLPTHEKLELCRRLRIPTLLHGDATTGEAVGDGVVRSELLEVEPVTPPRGCALVKLTSGSTGDPVGICLDEESLLAGIRQIAEGMSLDAADRVLIAIPLSHSYGFDNGVLSLAVLGTPLVLEPRFLPSPLLQALSEGEITFFPAVPPLVRALAGTEWPADLPLRTVISAGGPLAPEVADAFADRAGHAVHQFFGSTETGGISYERAPDDPGARGTVGHPLPGVEIVLGEDARVRVASRANFGGYLGVDAELADRLVTTGDTGEWTAAGRLRLTGRACDLLNVGGRRISALTVERVLRGIPGVRDVAVVGVEDAVRGDRMVAFVVSDEETLDLSPLPRGLCPRDVRRVDALPYTERGKLDRRGLRARARERR
jgi:acyl-CoA synthetase (AMP-forming)/AMP-acid ligase II